MIADQRYKTGNQNDQKSRIQQIIQKRQKLGGRSKFAEKDSSGMQSDRGDQMEKPLLRL